jgi:hypothetical protein
MGNNSFAPYPKFFTSFVVKNIASPAKVIRIFHYPIRTGLTRDLLAIPGVAESDIRASLLKGELLHKIKSKDIEIITSDIDLLQFNNDQKAFLQAAGVVDGLEIAGTGGTGTGGFDVQDALLIGVQNNINTTFTTPTKFKHTADFKEVVYINGLRSHIPEDYFVAESGGLGTGYDTVVFVNPPEPNDLLVIDYFEVV